METTCPPDVRAHSSPPPRKQFARSHSLHKQPRIKEIVITRFLFVCGALSILTTIGIVSVLAKESLSFFTTQLWENSNKELVVAIDDISLIFEATKQGAALEVGQIVRLGDEVMKVVGMDGLTFMVDRGLQGSEMVHHEAGVEIFTADRVSLLEFLTHTEWNPQIGDFGIIPLVTATMMTSLRDINEVVAANLRRSISVLMSASFSIYKSWRGTYASGW